MTTNDELALMLPENVAEAFSLEELFALLRERIAQGVVDPWWLERYFLLKRACLLFLLFGEKEVEHFFLDALLTNHESQDLLSQSAYRFSWEQRRYHCNNS